MSRKKKEPAHATYRTLGPFSVMRKPVLSESGRKFYMDVTTEGGVNTQYECSKELFKEVVSDQLWKNYRFHFTLHVNEASEKVERISTEPKNIYDSYTVEYEDDMKVPEKELYTDPEVTT